MNLVNDFHAFLTMTLLNSIKYVFYKRVSMRMGFYAFSVSKILYYILKSVARFRNQFDNQRNLV